MRHEPTDDYGAFTPRHLDPIARSVPDVYPVREGFVWVFACVDCGARVERDYQGAVPLLRPFCQPCRDVRTGTAAVAPPAPTEEQLPLFGAL